MEIIPGPSKIELDYLPDDSAFSAHEIVDAIPEPSAEEPITILIRDSATKDEVISFTIEMKTILPQYTIKESKISRTRAEFEWLHQKLCESKSNAGIIIPPLPSKPDFTVNRDSISVYTEDENTESEDYKKMRRELEREYLALFKKAVSGHELMLRKISRVSVLRTDPFFIEFLTSPNVINTKVDASTMVSNIFRYVSKSFGNNVINALANVKDPDLYFEEEKHFYDKYSSMLNSTISFADSMISAQKRLSNCMIKVSSSFINSAANEYTKLSRIQEPIGFFFDKARKVESRFASDEDLKLLEAFKYHYGNSCACQDLLNQRITCLVEVDKNLKALEKAKQSNTNVSIADSVYQQSFKNFESISESAKFELQRENQVRVDDYRRDMTAYCELQISQLKVLQKETQLIIDRIEAEDCL